ncbi:unnamed protein product, partial [Mesorhabditis belari]|uniref:Uncharacterized protein n=1 Tax=Mesorhabditis belari TaxID=2138241 RepID=A0AAF3F0G7_9BILA
ILFLTTNQTVKGVLRQILPKSCLRFISGSSLSTIVALIALLCRRFQRLLLRIHMKVAIANAFYGVYDRHTNLHYYGFHFFKNIYETMKIYTLILRKLASIFLPSRMATESSPIVENPFNLPLGELGPSMENVMRTLFSVIPGLSMGNAEMMETDLPCSSEDASSQSTDPLLQSPQLGDENTMPNGLLNSLNNEKNDCNSKNEAWFQCFTTQSQKELDALIYSLFAAPRVEKKGDGFEHFECLNRAKFKCRFRLRVKRINEWYIVEERSGHSHSSDLAAIPTQGLAKSIREIVDQSFHEDWPTQMRQERIEQEMRRLGLPANPRLSRQIDNRVSYLRRVKNLSEVKRVQEEMDPLNTLQAINGNSLQNTPTKALFGDSSEGSPFKPVIPGSHSQQQQQVNFDFNAILNHLQQQSALQQSPLKATDFVNQESLISTLTPAIDPIQPTPIADSPADTTTPDE